MTQYLTKETLHIIRKSFKKNINLKSSALAEALASGYGYKSSISLIAGLKVKQIYIYDFNILSFYNRLYQLTNAIPDYSQITNLIYKILDGVQPYKNKNRLIIGSAHSKTSDYLMSDLEKNIKGNIVFFNVIGDPLYFKLFDDIYPNQCWHITQSSTNKVNINPLLDLNTKQICEVISLLINAPNYPGVQNYLYEFISVLEWIVAHTENTMTFQFIADNIMLDNIQSFQQKFHVPFEICGKLYSIIQNKNHKYILMQFVNLLTLNRKELQIFSQSNAVSWNVAIQSYGKLMFSTRIFQDSDNLEKVLRILTKTLDLFIQHSNPTLSIVSNAVGYTHEINTIYPNINYVYSSPDFNNIFILNAKDARDIIGKIKNITFLGAENFDHDSKKISKYLDYEFYKKMDFENSKIKIYQLLKNDHVDFNIE